MRGLNLLLLASIALTAGCGNWGNPCSQDAALVLARAYILAQPLLVADDIYINNGEPLRKWVAQRPDVFGREGVVTRCAARVGPRIAQQGIGLYDPNAYEKVMDSSPAEISHLSQDVADRMNDSATNLFELGQELTWLAEILPAVADGDLEPFLNTGYTLRNEKKQLAQAAFANVRAMCQMDPAGCRENFSMMVPALKKAVDETQYATAYSIVMLAD